jgi:hypothetical protein
MFTGTTIDELIRSVERAEQHAHNEHEPAMVIPNLPVYQNRWQPMAEVR